MAGAFGKGAHENSDQRHDEKQAEEHQGGRDQQPAHEQRLGRRTAPADVARRMKCGGCLHESRLRAVAAAAPLQIIDGEQEQEGNHQHDDGQRGGAGVIELVQLVHDQQRDNL